jgi:protein-disulfide isomerase
MPASPNKSKSLILASVLLGLCLVVAVVYKTNAEALSANQVTIERAESVHRHVYGDPSAAVKVVEFSDYQCPFCADLHPELKRLVDESDGQISWEYRHLPLASHPLARPAAVMLECVARELGNEAFWAFTTEIFQNQDSISAPYLYDEAKKRGLTEAALTACENDQTIQGVIDIDQATAEFLGASGTPFSVIIYPDQTYKTVTGANPYEQWVALTEKYVK